MEFSVLILLIMPLCIMGQVEKLSIGADVGQYEYITGEVSVVNTYLGISAFHYSSLSMNVFLFVNPAVGRIDDYFVGSFDLGIEREIDKDILIGVSGNILISYVEDRAVVPAARFHLGYKISNVDIRARANISLRKIPREDPTFRLYTLGLHYYL
jgi:hypothetical protein